MSFFPSHSGFGWGHGGFGHGYGHGHGHGHNGIVNNLVVSVNEHEMRFDSPRRYWRGRWDRGRSSSSDSTRSSKSSRSRRSRGSRN